MSTLPTSSTARARDAIEPIARELGGRVVERVIVGEDASRTVIDLVVVDRYGCLIIDLEVWPGARILGSSDAESWAARSQAGSQLFENPFARASAQADTLAALLAGRTPLVDRAHVSTLVAFDAGSLDSVEVTEQQRFKMVGFEGLATAIADRHDFAINAGVLDTEGVAALSQFLEGMSSAGAHQSAATTVQVPQPPLPGYRPSADFAPQPMRAPSRSSRAVYPPPQPSGTPEVRGAKVRRLRLNVSVFVALVLAGAAVWMFYYGGLDRVVGTLTGSVNGLQGRYTSEVQAGPKGGVSATPEQALAALEDGAPDVAEALTDPGRPQLAPAGEYTVYVWTYHPKGAPADQTDRVRVIFDAGGVLRGIEQGQ